MSFKFPRSAQIEKGIKGKQTGGQAVLDEDILLDRENLLEGRSSLKVAFILIRQHISNHRAYVYFSVPLLLFVTSFLTFSTMGFYRHHRDLRPERLSGSERLPGFEYTSSGELLSCGSNFEEAETAGCIFDIMTFAWTPPACLDTEVHTDVVSELSELAPTRTYLFGAFISQFHMFQGVSRVDSS